MYQHHQSRRVEATVDEVLQLSGLAFLRDDADREWTVTRCTPGARLERLTPGQRCRLVVDEYKGFAIATELQPL